MTTKKTPITAKKSYRTGYVSVCINMKVSGYGSGRVKFEAHEDLTCDQARTLALSLNELAEKAEAKVVANKEHEERRKKYREREIAAGRTIVMGGLRG